MATGVNILVANSYNHEFKIFFDMEHGGRSSGISGGMR